MSKQYIGSLQPANGAGYIMPSLNINPTLEEKNLEKILNEADFYVTNTDLYLDNVNKIKINNFYIFFY